MPPLRRPLFVIYLASTLAATTLLAQTAGRITGTVVDPTQNVVVGAEITLINEGTGQTSATQSNNTGAFIFPNALAGTYTVRVQAPGFSVLERSRQVLNAGESLALGDLELAVGTVSEKVTVEAQGTVVQTDSSNQTAVLTTSQLGGLMSRGRDIVSLMTVLPGVTQNASSDSLGGNWGTGTPNMQGMRSHWNTFLLDGQPGSDIDVLNFFTISVSMDTISEVAVKQTSYLAEEGRNPGVHVNIISKSATKEFHGSAYWFKRHEMFNANNFFNNRLGIAKPLTRYNTYGGVLGGPVYIPKVWNTSKDKLFFFVSEELWRV
ncbi:MAG: carboxypeptidase regulatory-like domain-containing protein, partial [Bryobacteraceae bacterium]